MELVKTFELGPMPNNSYLIKVNNDYIVIDAPFGSEKIISYLEEKNIEISSIFLTHTHYDHIACLELFRDKYPNLNIYVSPKEKAFLKDSEQNLSNYSEKAFTYNYEVKTFEQLNQDDFNMEIVYISGHSKQGANFIFKEEKIVFSGDCLFNLAIGRTDLYYGDKSSLVSGIKSKLLTLGEDFSVYPGHGKSTTIRKEKMENPFLK